MSQTTRKFELIDDTAPASPAAAPPAAGVDPAIAARQLLFTALRALSQRAQTAITNLFSLFLVGSVAVLLGRVLGELTQNQLVGVGGYAVFCLLIDIVRRKTK